MPKICYRSKRFSVERLQTISNAEAIISEYSRKGYELTLRQLYYQFVARGLIANNMREYKNLGDVLNDARLAGEIDWLAIVDRTRYLQSLSHWDSPAQIVRSCSLQFRFDLWHGQSSYVEVWVEKDALVGVVERAANRWDVPFFSCRGYTSQSEMWSAGQRLKERSEAGRDCTVLHLGDHDPSGIDMSRDIEDRLTEFSGNPVNVVRLALNMDQVRTYNPPPNPAKLTDSRCQGYMAKHGDESWELDALDPQVIDTLISDAIEARIDQGQFSRMQEKQDTAREQLKAISDRWPEVVKQFGGA